jgi:hypothetical protein
LGVAPTTHCQCKGTIGDKGTAMMAERTVPKAETSGLKGLRVSNGFRVHPI